MKYFSFSIITMVAILVSWSVTNSINLILAHNSQVNYAIPAPLIKQVNQLQSDITESITQAIVDDFNQ